MTLNDLIACFDDLNAMKLHGIPLHDSQIENSIDRIRERNGSVDPFYKEKISNAIFKALAAFFII